MQCIGMVYYQRRTSLFADRREMLVHQLVTGSNSGTWGKMHIPAVAAVHGRPLRQLSSVLAYVAASARLRPVLLDTGNLLSQGRSCCRPHHRKFICSTSTFINPQSSQMSWNGKTAVITGIARPAGTSVASCCSILHHKMHMV